jgi:hypothetical protein
MERTAILLIAAVTMVGCSPPRQAAQVADGLRSALDCRGLHDVAIDHDAGTGRIILRGEVPTLLDKLAAVSVAHSVGPVQVEVGVVVVAAPHGEPGRAHPPRPSWLARAPNRSAGGSHRKRQPLEWQTWDD